MTPTLPTGKTKLCPSFSRPVPVAAECEVVTLLVTLRGHLLFSARGAKIATFCRLATLTGRGNNF